MPLKFQLWTGEIQDDPSSKCQRKHHAIQNETREAACEEPEYITNSLFSSTTSESLQRNLGASRLIK